MKSKNLLYIIILFNYLNVLSQSPIDYASTITLKELKDKLYTYSSDDFEGRETGKKGQKLASSDRKSR